MLILLYAALFAANAVNSFFAKKYSDQVTDLTDACAFSVITGMIACLFFFCSGGFHLAFNTRTVIYSAVFAVIVLGAQVLGLFALQTAGVTKKMVIGSAVSLPSIFVVGLLCFRETFAWATLASCLLMIAAGVLIAVARPHTETEPHGSHSTLGILLSVLAGLTTLFSTVLSKLFANDLASGAVTDTNSYFFLTNVFLVGFCILVYPFLCCRSGRRVTDDLKELSPRRIGLIVLSTLASNAGSLLGVQILLIGTVSLYGPLSSALTMLAGFAVGLLCFREKPQILPMLLALASVGLGFFA